MINKKNLWFLTLFSLILVLSIYYITMPSELLMTTKEKVNNITKQQKEKKKSKSKEIVKEVEEADIISAMRIESDSVMKDEIDKLQLVINNEKSTVDDKNKAYDKIKEINNNRALEEQLEKKLKDELKLDSYIKIEDNKIKVTINSSEHDASSANKIMRNIQSNFDEFDAYDGAVKNQLDLLNVAKKYKDATNVFVTLNSQDNVKNGEVGQQINTSTGIETLKNNIDVSNVLPKEVLRLQRNGLSLRFCEDLKSYKKIIT